MLSLRPLNILCVIFVALAISACTHVTAPEDVTSEIEGLAQAIDALSKDVSPTDASQTSSLLINTAIELADEYDMASPPKYHNLLVHMGIRERGLCCHWAEDLLTKLRELPTSSLKFDWLVARQGVALREHSTVVVYAADSTWAKGIVFDPWRKAGVPHWTNVAGDEYPWQPHPLSGRWEILRCK